MRGIAVLVAAFGLLGVVSASADASGSQTTLTVTYWPDGAQKAEKTVWTLDCRTGTGTLKRPGVACAHLAAGGWKLFAPVRKDEVCTEIYGGPQMALVVGTVEGRRVWAREQRRNGCETARWNRLTPWLLPPGGVT